MSESFTKANLIGAFITPPRKWYDPFNLPLFLDSSSRKKYVRQPIQFQNSRQISSFGSLYEFQYHHSECCIIFLHSELSSQLECQYIVPIFSRYSVGIFSYDLPGCGFSHEKTCRWGYDENDDISIIIQLLKKAYNFSQFILWGRNLGANIALRYHSPNVIGKIIDSPYPSISGHFIRATEILNIDSTSFKNDILTILQSSLKNNDLQFESLEYDKNEVQDVPILMAHSNEDQIQPYEEVKQFFDSLNAERKEFITLSGEHGAQRTLQWLIPVFHFIRNCFKLENTQVHFGENRKLQWLAENYNTYEELIRKFEAENGTPTQILKKRPLTNFSFSSNEEYRNVVEELLTNMILPETVANLTFDKITSSENSTLEEEEEQ